MISFVIKALIDLRVSLLLGILSAHYVQKLFSFRFGQGSELEKMGNVISPGDEILNVNNVEVQTMSIDDVRLLILIDLSRLFRLFMRFPFQEGSC